MCCAFSRYLIGDAVADDLNIHSSVPAAMAVRLVRTAVGAVSASHRFVPDTLLRRIEDMNFALGRRTLKAGLGGDPARWGFKDMA